MVINDIYLVRFSYLYGCAKKILTLAENNTTTLPD